MEFLFSSLSQYKYFILLPLAIVEGPIVSVIAGLLCSGGVLELQYVFPLLVIGDVIGDFCYYSLGRWSQTPGLKKIGNRLGTRPQSFDGVRTLFHNNPIKMISLSKIFPGMGVLGLVAAGNAKLSYFLFLRIGVVITILQAIMYLSIGLLFGAAFIEINRYLNWLETAGVIIFLGVLAFVGIRSLTKTT